jgi:hypothetical protein
MNKEDRKQDGHRQIVESLGQLETLMSVVDDAETLDRLCGLYTRALIIKYRLEGKGDVNVSHRDLQ